MKAPKATTAIEGMELRQNARVTLDASVFVSCKGRLFSGRLEDMSTQSVRVRLNTAAPIGQLAEVIIVHAGKQTVVRGELETRPDGSLIVRDHRDNEALRNLFFNSIPNQAYEAFEYDLEMTDETQTGVRPLTLK